MTAFALMLVLGGAVAVARQAGQHSERVVTGSAGLFTTFMLVTSQYAAHTFEQWQDDAAGALGHVLGQGSNQMSSSNAGSR